MAVIALGSLLGHLGVLDLPAQVMLSRLSFLVASPALMVTVLQDTDVAQVFSRSLVATAAAVLVTGVVYVVTARLVWRRRGPDLVLGTLSSVYVNAGNLGLPIAAYVLGDASLIAPLLLMQILVIQPVALGLLTTMTADTPASAATMLRPLTMPLTVASMLGLLLAVTGWRLPVVVQDPLELVAAMAVPTMLLAYGVSLRLGPRPGSGGSFGETALTSTLKLGLQPLVGWVVARAVLGLEGDVLLGVVVLAALPTAQNIFVHATTFDRSTVLVRDTIFVTTVLSLPVIVGIAALLLS